MFEFDVKVTLTKANFDHACDEALKIATERLAIEKAEAMDRLKRSGYEFPLTDILLAFQHYSSGGIYERVHLYVFKVAQ